MPNGKQISAKGRPHNPLVGTDTAGVSGCTARYGPYWEAGFGEGRGIP
jgi:hypothetical protein